jgi:aspartate kinase
VALAAALEADRCEILTDVDAVYTADPRVVPGARPIPEIRFEDMAELARHGAVVLKEECVRFAERNGIEVKVGSSSTPGPGTIVLERPRHAEPPVVGLALLPEARLLVWPDLGPAAAARRLSVEPGAVKFLASAGGVTVAAVVASGPLDDERGGPAGARESAVSLLCMAGAAAAAPATIAAAGEVLAASGAAPSASASSGRSTVFAVAAPAAESALRALHDALLGSDPPRA